MSTKATEKAIRDLAETLLTVEGGLPVAQFGSRTHEAVGAQIMVQCDRPSVVTRDKAGRAVEWEYALIVHLFIHSQKLRDDQAAVDAHNLAIDTALQAIVISDIQAVLQTGEQCTQLMEGDGDYIFAEQFDDHTTRVDIYIARTS